MKTIFLTQWLDLSDAHKKMLTENENFDSEFKHMDELVDSDYDETEVLVGNLDPKMLSKFKSLKWLQLQSAGTDGYTNEGILPLGCQLTNATGTYGLTIAEHMLAMTMLLQRKFHVYQQNQNEEIWRHEGGIQSVYGSTFVIIGLGDIGTEFAKRVKALGGYTIGVKRTIYGDEEYCDELYRVDELDKVLERADVVTMSVPGTPETYKMFGAKQFAKMKSNGIFINVGRGTSVDMDALCDGLEQGVIMGASIDVTDPEPLPKGHRGWKTPNLMITPHCSGSFYLEETKLRFLKLTVENMNRFAKGEPLLNEVNFETGYRKKLNT